MSSTKQTRHQHARAVSEADMARSSRASRTATAYPSACPFCATISSSVSIVRSRSSSARMAPANRRCSKGSQCWPAMTRPAAARAICRSIIPGDREDGRSALEGAARKLAAKDHQRAGSFVRSFFSVRLSRPGRVRKPNWDHRPTSSRTPMAKAFCAFSRSAVSARASSSSTSPNRRCRRHGRSSF